MSELYLIWQLEGHVKNTIYNPFKSSLSLYELTWMDIHTDGQADRWMDCMTMVYHNMGAS